MPLSSDQASKPYKVAWYLWNSALPLEDNDVVRCRQRRGEGAHTYGT